tara:strand:+ start:6195 stop:8168 length:1974 start_codon:yes stop_codon:yes gene_type:complete
MSDLTDSYITYSDALRFGADEADALIASGLTSDQAAALRAQMNTGALDRNIYPAGQSPRAKAIRGGERRQRMASAVVPAGETGAVESSEPVDVQALVDRWNEFQSSKVAEEDEAAFRRIEEAEALNLGALPTERPPRLPGSEGMYLSTPTNALESGLESFIGAPSVSPMTGKEIPGYTTSKKYLTGKQVDFIRANPQQAIQQGLINESELQEIMGAGVNVPLGNKILGIEDKVVPGTSAKETGTGGKATVDKSGNVVVPSSQFNQLIRRAQAGLSRGRAAGLEAAGTVDYQEQANEMARAQGEAREKYDREMREYEAMQERQRLSLDKTEQEMRMAEQELKDGTIDPNRAYGGLGGRVAAAFATAIGAFAQGISGGKIPNTALQIIDGAINRDIFAQKEEMRKRKDVLVNKNNIYAQMMKRFGDERMAEQAAINMGYNVAKMKIGELATRHKGAAQQAAAQQLIAQAENKYAEGNAKLAQLVGQRDARLAAGGKGKGKTEQTQRLFQLALGEIKGLREKFKKMGTFEAFRSGIAGFLGPDAQVTLSSKPAARYAAARFGVAQFVNKAFSGARGSDRDLAAVMARIPSSWNKTFDEESGLALIDDLEKSLMAAAGDKGYLAEDDIANYFDARPGGKAATNDALKSFQSEIDEIQGEGK